VEVEREDAEQHHHAADQRVEEELDRRVQPPVAAPDADEEVHRHQHDLPEQEEQQEVERNERADHAGLEHQQEDVVLLHALPDGRPRRQDRDRAQQRRHQDQQDAEAVDAEEVVSPDRRDPRHALDELVLGAGAVVPEPQRHRHHEPEDRDDVRDPPDQILLTPAHEEQQDGPRERREEDE
jgi:hypothetical protein